LSDAEGLGLAYASREGIYVNGATMYIAGTRTHSQLSRNPFHEWVQDLYIPLGRTGELDRYKSASHFLHGVDRVVGHSMGGSVALELQRLHHVDATTYGAPVMSFSSGDRFRDPLDPFSAFDFGSKNSGFNFPHAFRNAASTARFGKR